MSMNTERDRVAWHCFSKERGEVAGGVHKCLVVSVIVWFDMDADDNYSFFFSFLRYVLNVPRKQSDGRSEAFPHLCVILHDLNGSQDTLFLLRLGFTIVFVIWPGGLRVYGRGYEVTQAPVLI